MDRIFDLPAHPLLVHFPIVAIPVVAIVSIVMAFVASFRRRYGLAVVGLAIMTTISAFLASSSGEELSEILGAEEWIETHENLANQLTWMVVALTVGLGSVAALDRWRPDLARAQRVLGTVVAVLGVVTLVWAVRTGHEGAKAHWEPIVPARTEEVSLTASESTDTTRAESTDTITAESTETTTTESTETTTTEASPTTGEGAETTTTESPETTTTEGAPDTSVAPTADGMAIYEANCQRCHRADGSGGRGPSLAGLAEAHPDPQEQIQTVIDGGRGMPTFGTRLSEAEIVAVVDYVRTAFAGGHHSHDG